MKKIAVIAISVMIMGLMISSANAASLGCIDYQKIFSTYDKTKKAEEQIKKKTEILQDEVTKKQKQVEKEKENGMANDDLKALVSKMQKDLEPKQAEIIALKQKLENEIREDIVKATAEISKKEGIETIVFKTAVVTGGIDITDKVINLLKK
jgi:Skp family chaperone for outer membrane proteins